MKAPESVTAPRYEARGALFPRRIVFFRHAMLRTSTVRKVISQGSIEDSWKAFGMRLGRDYMTAVLRLWQWHDDS